MDKKKPSYSKQLEGFSNDGIKKIMGDIKTLNDDIKIQVRDIYAGPRKQKLIMVYYPVNLNIKEPDQAIDAIIELARNIK